MRPSFHLGNQRDLAGRKPSEPRYQLPAHHLVTHGVVLGMTGSGKTGLVTVLAEEALQRGVPIVAIDVKGDLPNLLLTPASFAPEAIAPWVEARGSDPGAVERLATARREGLLAQGIGEPEVAAYAGRTHVRVVTPGSDAGELLHVLSSLERRSSRWETDPDGARSALSAAISLILRLLGRDADPARSRDHVLLSVLAEKRLREGGTADLPALLEDLATPPIASIGALDMDAFMSKKARKDLAAALNNLLAAPTFTSWRQGESLDVGSWMKPVPSPGGATPRTPLTIVSVAHLDDDERELVLGLVLEEILTWVRGLPGSSSLDALIIFDEVYGFLPPHPANPPTKRPLVALMKQARAFGVGVIVATQNPMDLDYRALSNAGFWALGRLQTDADRERVIDGLAREAGLGASAEELQALLKRLAPRWFLTNNVHEREPMSLLQPRFAMSLLRGPMTRAEIRRARALPLESGGAQSRVAGA